MSSVLAKYRRNIGPILAIKEITVKNVITTLVLLGMLLSTCAGAHAAPSVPANTATISMVTKETRSWSMVYPVEGKNVVAVPSLPVTYSMNVNTAVISAVLTIEEEGIVISKISETDYVVKHNGQDMHWNPQVQDLQISGIVTATILGQAQKFDLKFFVQADNKRMWVTWHAVPAP
jgi:hypothetical protein